MPKQTSDMPIARRRNHGRGHSYEIDGRRVDGVTWVLSNGVPKPALIDWAARTVAGYAVDHWDELADETSKQTPPRALERSRFDTSRAAMARGTDVHTIAMQLASGEEVDVPEAIAGYVDAYLRFVEEWKPAELLVEVPVFNRAAGYAGTLDLVADLADGARWLLDWKTGDKGTSSPSPRCNLPPTDTRSSSSTRTTIRRRCRTSTFADAYGSATTATTSTRPNRRVRRVPPVPLRPTDRTIHPRRQGLPRGIRRRGARRAEGRSMNTALVPRPVAAGLELSARHRWVALLGEASQLAHAIANTNFVPASMRGDEAAITAAILYSGEIGLPPMQALAKIAVIDGKPSVAAEAQRALIVAAGHELWFEEFTSTKVTWCGRRLDTGIEQQDHLDARRRPQSAPREQRQLVEVPAGDALRPRVRGSRARRVRRRHRRPRRD